jgi:hypothetical protein
VEFVMEFLADRVSDSSDRNELNGMLADGVAFLNLGDPAQSELVDLIADALPSHIAEIDDVQLRENLQEQYSDLYEYAREQQNYNRDPTQDSYFTIGPSPAQYFDLNILDSSVLSHLKKVDYVYIDVSDYTEEQRTAVRNYVAGLANPRVLVVGDD